MKRTSIFKSLTAALVLFLLGTPAVTFGESQRPNTPLPPGTVIAASPDWANVYYGTPSMEIMEDGTYVFTHDWFGPGTKGELTCVYQSHDRGASWEKVSEFTDQKSGTIFRIGAALYHIGFYRPNKPGMSNECIAIRRSDDEGKTWSVPTDAAHGLLCSDDRYYSDPVPVLIHDGRVFWQIARVNPKKKDWPPFDVLVISAPRTQICSTPRIGRVRMTSIGTKAGRTTDGSKETALRLPTAASACFCESKTGALPAVPGVTLRA